MSRWVWDKLWISRGINAEAKKWWTSRLSDNNQPMVFFDQPALTDFSLEEIRRYEKFKDINDYTWFNTGEGKVLWIRKLNLNEPDPSLRWVIECRCWKFHFMKWKSISRVKEWKNRRGLLCFDCVEKNVQDASQV